MKDEDFTCRKQSYLCDLTFRSHPLLFIQIRFKTIKPISVAIRTNQSVPRYEVHSSRSQNRRVEFHDFYLKFGEVHETSCKWIPFEIK